MNLYTQLAWTWPYIAGSLGTVAGIGLLMLATWAITRAVMLRDIERRMPSESVDRILRSRRAAAHYKGLYESELVTSAHLRAVIRGSVGTAAATIQQLQGGE